ncbi:uncharacterized protein LOC114327956 [Diabrotica virgifera virgifera]|uniref:CST complex subunit STN1 n=1 Tax=Diabrotica virgifera virgifera TaxID=50390 RepID=A0ABM5IGW5_DIAVI|nr:uncharacterized protein LOC114327956 [Diabrotica virgifera virgifera]
MDVEGTSSSVKGELFESEKWVMTKNVKGAVKVATCEADETQLYNKTRDWIVTEDEKDPEYGPKSNPKYEQTPMTSKNIGRFFIRDLLTAEKVAENAFVCKDITFSQVLLCGNVVNKYEYSEHYFIDVDDGTSAIRCIIGVNDLNKLKTLDSDLETCKEWLRRSTTKKTPLVKGAQITLSSINYLQKAIPTFNEIELGDTIKVYGRLKENSYGRNVFISKIWMEQNNPLVFNKYLEEMIDVYENHYNIRFNNRFD